MSRLPAFHRVHLCRCAGSFGAILLTLAKMDKIPCLLSALSLCLWRAMPEYGSISRSKGVFSGFWGFRVGLCCLGGLRGLWGFCARVELGGYMACGVFAFLFLSLSLVVLVFIFVVLLFVLLSLLVLLCSACPLSLWVVVSFSLSVYAQKERAQSVVLASSLRLLWVALSGCGFIFLVLVRCQPVYIVIEF